MNDVDAYVKDAVNGMKLKIRNDYKVHVDIVVNSDNESYTDNAWNALASFIIVARKEDGTLIDKTAYDGPCHYDLRKKGYEYLPTDCNAVALIDFSHRYKLLDDSIQNAAKSFIKFIALESPWKDCYIKTRNRYSNVWHMNVKRSGNELASACIAMRQAFEFGKFFLPMWQWLLEQNIDKRVAWLISYFISKKGDEFQFSSWHGGHDVMSTSAYYEDVFSFLANGLPGEVTDSYSEVMNYDDVYGVIGVEISWTSPNGIENFIKHNCYERVTGSGFDVKKVIPEKSVLDLCALIASKIEEAKHE